MQNRAYALGLLILLSSCMAYEEGRDQPVAPRRPTISSGTTTTPAGRIELETGVALDPGDAFSAPLLLKWGYDAETELSIGWSPFVWRDSSRGEDGETVGDILVGYRRRFQEQYGERIPSLAADVTVKVPTADEDEVGTGEFDLFVGGIAELVEDDISARGYAQLGLLGQEDESSDIDSQVVLALAAEQTFQESGSNASAFGEIAQIWVGEQDYEATLLTLGGRWPWTLGRMFDLGVAVGLSDDAPDLVFLVGFTTGLGVLGPRAARP
jgi:hypothetical protein